MYYRLPAVAAMMAFSAAPALSAAGAEVSVTVCTPAGRISAPFPGGGDQKPQDDHRRACHAACLSERGRAGGKRSGC